MKSIIKVIRKIGVLIVGLALLVIGVILIPLPGPGLLICFAGLFVLSLEFESAKPHRQRIEREFKKIINNAKERQAEINRKAQADDPDRSTAKPKNRNSNK